MSSTAPRFSVGLPQLLDRSGPRLLATFAKRAEQADFAGLWTIDNAVGGPTASRPVLDAVHALTYVASVTDRIRLGTAVLVLPRRNPVLLAKELATLDQLSGGRLVVGVGAGRDDGTAAKLGFPTDRALQRLVDGVETLRAAWSGSLAVASVQPRPAQQGGPPIWFGVAGPRSLRCAARLADGWIGAGASTLEQFTTQMRFLQDALCADGRAPETLWRAKRVYIGVEPSRKAARRRVAAALDDLYGTDGLGDDVGLYGTRGECAEELRLIVQAGANELVLTPLYDHLRQLDELAAVRELVSGA